MLVLRLITVVAYWRIPFQQQNLQTHLPFCRQKAETSVVILVYTRLDTNVLIHKYSQN